MKNFILALVFTLSAVLQVAAERPVSASLEAVTDSKTGFIAEIVVRNHSDSAVFFDPDLAPLSYTIVKKKPYGERDYSRGDYPNRSGHYNRSDPDRLVRVEPGQECPFTLDIQRDSLPFKGVNRFSFRFSSFDQSGLRNQDFSVERIFVFQDGSNEVLDTTMVDYQYNQTDLINRIFTSPIKTDSGKADKKPPAQPKAQKSPHSKPK